MNRPAMILTATLTLAALAPAADEGKHNKVQGTWAAVQAAFDGKKAQDEVVRALEVVITGDTITITSPSAVEYFPSETGTYKLDPSSKPKTIDLTLTAGPNKGKTLAGIYQLEGDNLKLCIHGAGKERPKEFDSKKGTDGMLLELKREKAKGN
jgi:uncharacterized protein (TIGR03067 family)